LCQAFQGLALCAEFLLIALFSFAEPLLTALEWVKNGRLNIGIAFDEENLDGLSTNPIVEEELFLMVNSVSPLAARKSITL
jgi:DNA-binding transcriptional LysR family regulator